ncbi:p24 family protein beta-1 [Geosmithia morbida]|uniref:P24 family protein beta-1 n=1 Tax=Geosmithia morbida TaxID=1094350 RepID=A0A9P5D220_9HYPO|nr:p24 family protein beta-1 [Geosmithia morbida]KAF4123377.1 p24 family protein beta-1 [Geosmithia morbida]
MRLINAVKSLLAAAVAIQTAAAHNIVLPSHGVECFYEDLHRDDTMTVTYQVGDREFGSAGNLEIDFWILNPRNQHEVQSKSVSSGDHSFTARHDGRYTYCFGNQHWGANTKEVSFNVHGIVYVSEGDMPSDPLEKEVRALSDLLAQVKDEQQYIVIRERTHRNTAESTNARVKWWNLFVIGIVIGESFFQVWWLRRFFEVKRVV